ncbi:hypothetical protein O1611_g5191 [Lasiodiplodia mahajangana]|uniref:Uncharacterized protein n=1 Tax=Lasiodiplodia mahajangana TaxID=1108764 RepID=A0ACC2JMI3_9PEZI|nr:hypothetical protein O1611_g5191 [Lasiodiplodia mahajangana]
MAPIYHDRSVNLPTQTDPPIPPHDTFQPLSCQNGIDTHNTNLPLPSIQLPHRISAYNKWGLKGLSTFYYCGESEKDRLYAVKIQHFASRAETPIGPRPGLFLHGGPSTSSPIVAASGEELLSPNEYVSRGPNTDLILLGSRDPSDGSDASSSLLRARITHNGMVAFTFQAQVSTQQDLHHELFSWIEIPKKSEPGFKRGGFKLARHPLKAQQGRVNRDPLSPERFWPSHDIRNEGEILATLSYGRFWQIKSQVKMFTIQFTSEATLSNIDDTLGRSILTTAAHLYQMKLVGMASPLGLEAAERRRTLHVYKSLSSNPARRQWATPFTT